MKNRELRRISADPNHRIRINKCSTQNSLDTLPQITSTLQPDVLRRYTHREIAAPGGREDGTNASAVSDGPPNIQKHGGGQASRICRAQNRNQPRFDLARNRWFCEDAYGNRRCVHKIANLRFAATLKVAPVRRLCRMEDSSEAHSREFLTVLGNEFRRQGFDQMLLARGCGTLARDRITTLQINVGKLCNQACQHCHVEAGPKRTESMSRQIAERVLQMLRVSPTITSVDITGGAPELNPNFRYLVTGSRELGRDVIDRCNLTVLLEPGMEDLGNFLAENQVEIIASLPCYTAENVDAQRGRGVFDKSIRALRLLNALGYGTEGSALKLSLVYNPLGATLPPDQSRLEAEYKLQLHEHFKIEFHRLFTLTNMPIKRFADFLDHSGKRADYMTLLTEHFNPATVSGLMCRSLVSVGWDGTLYDCDFNQMLEIGIGGDRLTVWDLESFGHLAGRRIATSTHCFGCTAGAGSSCGGALL